MGTIPTNYVALTDYLGEHLSAEQGALDAYQRLLDRRSDETDDAVSYLIRTILADEARHHEIFAQILNSLESIVRWEDITPRVPTARVEVEDRDELLATTDRLLELERDDLKELKALRKAWAKAGGDFELTGGFWVVVRTIGDCPGDFNGDGQRNFTDFTVFSLAFNSAEGDPNWNPDCNLNGDGLINFTDFTNFSLVYQVPCP